jgi:TldD protein
MTTTRREFLAAGSLVSAAWLVAPRAIAAPEATRGVAPQQVGASGPDGLRAASELVALARLARRAVDLATSKGASYADARLVAMTREDVSVRDAAVDRVFRSDELGMSVRVLVEGSWGFAATPRLGDRDVDRAVATALAGAKAQAALRKRVAAPPVELAKVEKVTGSWVTPHAIDPFSIDPASKADLLLRATAAVLAVPGVSHARAEVTTVREDKLLVTSDGSELHQVHLRIAPELSATAVDRKRGRFASRDHEAAPLAIGWEYVEGLDLPAAGTRIAEDVLRKLAAPQVEPGDGHVILAPSNLYLTIHESIGHPTELDRAMGLEANFAGTSFLSLADTGKLQYGSEIVDVFADRTQAGGLATTGWDDEGVATSRWPIISKGKLVGWQTTREQAGWIGESTSRGCSYGHGYDGVQFQRMPNVSLQPGKEGYTTEDLINATDKGVYITGRGSWSIDQQRHNFQFGGQMFWKIEKGRIVSPLRDVAYQANTVQFWNSCDMLGGASTYRLGGSFGDGKGEPQQMNAVSHGCPPARFKATIVRTAGAT